MQGDPKVIEYLNKGLRSELTAINQYWLHYRLLNNWGLLEMAKVWRKESIEEMEHADKFTDRILFLDGFPNMQVLDPLRIGQNVKEIIECDLAAEIAARALYQEAATHCHGVKDYVSRDLFEQLMKDEEHHIDFLETQLDLITAHRPRTLHAEARRRPREREALDGKLERVSSSCRVPAIPSLLPKAWMPGQARLTAGIDLTSTAASCSAPRPPPGFPRSPRLVWSWITSLMLGHHRAFDPRLRRPQLRAHQAPCRSGNRPRARSMRSTARGGLPNSTIEAISCRIG